MKVARRSCLVLIRLTEDIGGGIYKTISSLWSFLYPIKQNVKKLFIELRQKDRKHVFIFMMVLVISLLAFDKGDGMGRKRDHHGRKRE